jgi:FAD/FMN-containing dehydrogenase
MVIDLSHMKRISIDLGRSRARAQAGLTLGEFVQATQEFGLATTTGTVGGTGLAGLTLGGGLGWLMGKYGLTVDNLLSVDLVTSGGGLLRASADEHPDLFWGIRGGGGNFGIVTSFEFQLLPVATVVAGKVMYPMSRAREVLRFYRDYTSNAPDELTASACLLTMSTGTPVIGINVCYCGSLAEGERALSPLREFGAPIRDLIRPRSYFNLVAGADAGAPSGRCYYQRASTLAHLSDEAIQRIVDYSAQYTSPFSHVLLQHLHGAATRIDPSATAFALRAESYVMSIVAAWDHGETAERHIEWADTSWSSLRPFASNGVYVNFLGDEGEGHVQAAYGHNYERLVALKNAYDPTNFFALNQNIKPTTSIR